jgi:predicted PurR-regulated permease PerM
VLEGTVVTPWLVGERIGLHPVAVIFAVLAGGQLFGFFGVLLALPAGAALLVALRVLRRHYLDSRFYRRGGKAGIS